MNNTTLDIYMNGKPETCIMPNNFEMKGGEASALITLSYLFRKTSKFKFWLPPMDPQKGGIIYSDGFARSRFSKFPL